MSPDGTSRADLHCHSTASQLSKLGVQRALGIPECATPPEEVYALAKRRGMDFVTITDHDTISGVLEIADRPDVFVSVELTTWFRDEDRAVHVLCWGITPEDHAWLQAHARDVETCAAYLHEHDVACALAHPFYAVEAPLLPRHRRRLAQLFPAWEVRNGARAPELNAPAATYVETHGGTGVGGSDDHAGVDIGRTYTATRRVTGPTAFLAEVRAGACAAGGRQGSAAKWAHAAVALAARAVGVEGAETPDPRATWDIVERVMRQGDARRGEGGGELGPEEARRLVGAWLDAMALPRDVTALLELLQAPDFSHSALERRARRIHERRLRAAAGAAAADPRIEALGAAARDLAAACTTVIPYVPAAAFLARERAKVAPGREEPPRVAVVADGIGAMHGVTHALAQLREHGVPGHEVEVIGTDADLDRRLASVTEIPVPHYPGLRLGVPSLHGVVDALADGRHDLVHLTAPGPANLAVALVARMMGTPVVGSYHTELAAYAELRVEDPALHAAARAALAAFYRHVGVVLSPSAAADASLRDLGVDGARIARWDRGVDTVRFDPSRRTRPADDGRVVCLYAGRLTREKGIDLLAEAMRDARRRDRRLELVVAGEGPEAGRLDGIARPLGRLEGQDLARAYADADLFVFPSRTDTFGQVVLEAQASGLPVIAVAEGGPRELVEDGVTGRLTAADPAALASAIASLAGDPAGRARAGTAARRAALGRSWAASTERLAAGYRRALAPPPTAQRRAA